MSCWHPFLIPLLDHKDFGSLRRVFSPDLVHMLTCYDGVINQSTSIHFQIMRLNLRCQDTLINYSILTYFRQLPEDNHQLNASRRTRILLAVLIIEIQRPMLSKRSSTKLLSAYTFSDLTSPPLQHNFHHVIMPQASKLIPAIILCFERNTISSCYKIGSTCMADNACFDPGAGNTYLYGCMDSTYTDSKYPVKCGYNVGKITRPQQPPANALLTSVPGKIQLDRPRLLCQQRRAAERMALPPPLTVAASISRTPSPGTARCRRCRR